ncbi:Uncharacterised protein [Neisseria meningitidis]|nr:Uncharacterised protein [Neisseria meningitidis]
MHALCVWRVRRREICLLFQRRAGVTGGTLSINRNTVYNDRLFHHIPERNNENQAGAAQRARLSTGCRRNHRQFRRRTPRTQTHPPKTPPRSRRARTARRCRHLRTSTQRIFCRPRRQNPTLPHQPPAHQARIIGRHRLCRCRLGFAFRSKFFRNIRARVYRPPAASNLEYALFARRRRFPFRCGAGRLF